MADKYASLAALQYFKQKLDGAFAKTVNNVAIDKNGNITLDPSQIAYKDGSVKDALDNLLYVKVAVNSVSNDVNNVELGTKVRAVTVSWIFNDAVITGATLNGTALTADELKAGKKAFTYPEPTGDAKDPALVATTEFKVTATDNRNATASKSTWVSFKLKKYYGVGDADGDAINNDFITGFGGTLADNRSGDFTVTADAGQYIYFAVPASFGTPTFKVGGFAGGFGLAKTFDFTNASGHTESYNVYKSANAGLGKTTVSVS